MMFCSIPLIFSQFRIIDCVLTQKCLESVISMCFRFFTFKLCSIPFQQYGYVFDSFSTVPVCVRFLFNSTAMCSIPFQQYRYVFDSGQAVDLCSISHSQIVFDSLLSICVRFLIKLFLIAYHLLVFDFIINYAKFFFNSILITYRIFDSILCI